MKRAHPHQTHPGKNLGMFLHKPKPQVVNALAAPMKPHMAPVRQTKSDMPRIPVAPKPVKTKIGKHRG